MSVSEENVFQAIRNGRKSERARKTELWVPISASNNSKAKIPKN
jgi:hypothetical protein